MRVGVLGTGMVGQALGSRLVDVGHDVVMGSRTPTNDRAAAWAAGHPERAAHGTFDDAARHGELLVNATPGTRTLDALGAISEDHLDGKVLIDVSNAIASHGPLMLDPVLDDSVAERVQRAHPGLRVVKALNTVNAAVMVQPGLLPEPTDVFMAGDDDAAKALVRELLLAFGWAPDRVRDLGGIDAARALETYLPFWLSVMQATGTWMFNVRLVRSS